ncbi:alpha/beta hydrolase [Ascidiimonas sp. W6]|uniref:alpha/beta hydrolase n=1 Tax=Ascidiimonas meishanensis TaxID=3128903 RepID=UPI0030EC9277
MQQKKLSLQHIIRPSKSQQEKNPALFLFHGYGSNEEDLFSFAGELPEELFIISARAPYELMPNGYAWYAIQYDPIGGKWSDDEQAKESREVIMSFIEEAILAYQLDASNISLLGFSQGTILSYAIALSYPDKIKNIVALSGFINENILVSGWKNNNFDSLEIYASHGNEDQIIPPDWARNAKKILEANHIKFVYEEYPVGHGVAPQNFHSFKKWLSERIS